ncbi:hypothetical protein PILCRDRAFT_511008 [Piloderma croceum F 1598]|uniref:Uncharacterized protein n=1 Tax=Piloderma croceum (strain F 1598) TaxID=765440 RepID=A0A0C3B484_PILCF|nr:hypothetical protein PILCRDRAFT_511008 [Piloderma croceum F 1598]
MTSRSIELCNPFHATPGGFYLRTSMGGRGFRREFPSSADELPESPMEKRPYVDPYIIQSSINDSILLKDTSGYYLTPTPFPAPVLRPHDRDPLSSTPRPVPIHQPNSAPPIVIQRASRSPSPILPPSRSKSPLYFLKRRSVSSSAISPERTSSIYSSFSPRASQSLSPSPSPSPPPRAFSLTPTTSTTPTPRVRSKSHSVSMLEGYEHAKKLKGVDLRRLSTPTPPPPAYTQYAIGQCGGRKRHWG